LVRFGVPFDTLQGELALGREAAHSRSRILHAGGDRTGAFIELALAARARADGITILEHRFVERIIVDGGRVTGVEALATEGLGERTQFACSHLILATGGAGQLYGITTNPPVATGDGIALAYWAGAELADLEFVQFHPTALRMPGVPTFLISEAVRGEGGILRSLDGRPFMAAEHPDADLAPRDIVARAIAREMERSGSTHVLLDVTHLDPATTAARFPQIYRYCLEHGLDITRESIPVSPAAHYMMGGVRTDTWGRTSIPGLYACGEVACTGVHGANRLASNSLLETVVFAQRAVEASVGGVESDWPAAESDNFDLPPPAPIEPAPPYDLATLQRIMWQHVGIERSGGGLLQAREHLAAMAMTAPWERGDRASLELRSLVTTARLVTEAALRRTESRGAHFRSDHPRSRQSWLRHNIIRRMPSGSAEGPHP
ncbi:MAG TPA: FAD-binding protein, partial [Dehalococcoidia bacterium]|nr:FAD-binding protein [Dehalococcoidia bacterium]